MSDSRPDGSPQPDVELLAAARRGDRDAIEALLRRHQPRLYAVCRRITGNPHDAEDACQEAMVAIVRGLGSFDGRSAFSTWVYRVTTNTCLDELRRRRRRPDPGIPDGMAEAATAGDPAEQAAARLDIDAALATLTPEFRAAVVLRDLCGLSYDEIAETLEIPAGTVRSRIARGRAALLPLLAPEEAGNNPAPSDRQSR
ncbi:MAG TPA: sigma-70 family RNA polymerase sigma factor [Acidimicrobiales bacterium]|nr:sigma-70 family RNA polymerase sigma factor [Acidimicrobiales bacterium]